MFWGLTLKANKRYTQVITKSFQLSQAALDLTSCEDGENVQVVLTSDDKTYVLCTLSEKLPQCLLNLEFTVGEKVSLMCKGNGVVHLTGALIQDMYDDEDDDDDSEEEDEEINDVQLNNSTEKKLKNKDKKEKEANNVKEVKETKKSQNKGLAALNDEHDSDESDDDFVLGEDEDDDDEMGEEEGSDEDDDDDEEDDDDDDEDDDDSDEETEEKEPKAKKGKFENQDQKPKQNGISNDKPSKHDKKNKQQQNQQKDKAGKKQVLQGGVIIEDLKIGQGNEAKPGKKVHVYYEGRLKDTNKVFDSTKQGAGFKFSLGRGEVIRGWDIGVQGMKVGGKRRITCPPAMAYGQKGSPPVIPGNATLVFEVELKNTN